MKRKKYEPWRDYFEKARFDEFTIFKEMTRWFVWWKCCWCGKVVPGSLRSGVASHFWHHLERDTVIVGYPSQRQLEPVGRPPRLSQRCSIAPWSGRGGSVISTSVYARERTRSRTAEGGSEGRRRWNPARPQKNMRQPIRGHRWEALADSPPTRRTRFRGDRGVAQRLQKPVRSARTSVHLWRRGVGRKPLGRSTRVRGSVGDPPRTPPATRSFRATSAVAWQGDTDPVAKVRQLWASEHALYVASHPERRRHA
jgi:hypothetical protein